MIEVDISNIWGNIEFSTLISMDSRLSKAAKILDEEGNPLTAGWDWMLQHSEEVFEEVAGTVTEMRSHSAALVVIGTATVNQYIRAAAAYNGSVPGGSSMELLFVGDTLSSDSLQRVVSRLQNTDFSVLVVDRITTVEEAISLRTLKWLLNRKYGPEQAISRIYFAVVQPEFKVFNLGQKSHIRSLYALGEKSRHFPAAACMIPIAAAGMDPETLTDGVRRAAKDLENHDMDNPAWLYTAARVMLREQGKEIEELHVEEARLQPFGHWCCQICGDAQQGSGNWITSILNPYAGYSYREHTFETIWKAEEKKGDSPIELDLQDADGLNFLAGIRLSQIEACAAEELAIVKTAKQFPVILIRAGKSSLRRYGYLTYFSLLSASLSTQILKTEDNSGETDTSLQNIVLDALKRKFRAY